MVREAREINFLAWHKGIKEFKLFLYEYARINMNKDGDYNHTHLLCVLAHTYVSCTGEKCFDNFTCYKLVCLHGIKPLYVGFTSVVRYNGGW